MMVGVGDNDGGGGGGGAMDNDGWGWGGGVVNPTPEHILRKFIKGQSSGFVSHSIPGVTL